MTAQDTSRISSPLFWLAAAVLASGAAAQIPYSTPESAPVAIAAGLLGPTDIFPDIVTSHGAGVRVHLNNGSGAFAPGVLIPGSQDAVHAAVGDLDASSFQEDLVTAHISPSRVVVRLSNAYPVYGIQTIAIPATPVEVLFMDLDYDQDRDLAVLTQSPNQIRLYTNDGAGAFSLNQVLSLSLTPLGFATGQINGAGGPELVYVAQLGVSGRAVVIQNNTSANTPTNIVFGTEQMFSVVDGASCVACDDLDGDGYDDIAVGNCLPGVIGQVSVLLGDGPASSGWPTSVTMSRTDWSVPNVACVRCITTFDQDCDGDVDLGLGADGAASGEAIVMRNNGNGGYPTSTPWLVGLGPVDIVAVDVLARHSPDLVTADRFDDQFTVVHFDIPICRHVLIGGIEDSFGTALPVNGPELACPRLLPAPYISARNFDDPGSNRYFVHSFQSLPSFIVGGQVTIQYNPVGAGNDTLGMGYDPVSNRFSWVTRQSFFPNTVTFDLQNLPGEGNLLPKINKDGLLDCYAQDDTDVDYIRVELWCCGRKDSTLPLDLVEPLCNGWTAEYTMSGMGPFDICALFLGSGYGFGLYDLCVVPPYFPFINIADANGVATWYIPLNLTLPPCTEVTMQGLALTNSGCPWEVSNTVFSNFFN